MLPIIKNFYKIGSIKIEYTQLIMIMLYYHIQYQYYISLELIN